MTTFLRTLVRALPASRPESLHDAPQLSIRGDDSGAPVLTFLNALMRALAAPAV
jgi:hypothetical protein